MKVGLGCSKFGSLVGGIDRESATRLVHAALDMGVTEFDTADIYGQGDSELFLGSALAGRNASITTKAGQQFSAFNRMVLPLKSFLTPVLRHSRILSRSASAIRSGELKKNFSRRYIDEALNASLRRLSRDYVDTFLLHGPDAEILRNGEAIGALDSVRRAGKAGSIGVSVDDIDSFAAAACDPRIQVIQFPVNQAHLFSRQLMLTATKNGVRLIGREILRGASTPESVTEALRFAAEQPLDTVLIGTRSALRLAQAKSQLLG